MPRRSFNNDENDWEEESSRNSQSRPLNQQQRNGPSAFAATKSPLRRSNQSQSGKQSRRKKTVAKTSSKSVLKKTSKFSQKPQYRGRHRRATLGNDSNYKNPTRRESLSERRKKAASGLRRRHQSTPGRRQNLVNSNRSFGNMPYFADDNVNADESYDFYDTSTNHSPYNVERKHSSAGGTPRRRPNNLQAEHTPRGRINQYLFDICQQQRKYLKNGRNPITQFDTLFWDSDGDDDVFEADEQQPSNSGVRSNRTSDAPPRQYQFQFHPNAVHVFNPEEQRQEQFEIPPWSTNFGAVHAIQRAQNSNNPQRPLSFGEALYPSASDVPPEARRTSTSRRSNGTNRRSTMNSSQRLFEIEDPNESISGASDIRVGSRDSSLYSKNNDSDSNLDDSNFSHVRKLPSITKDWGDDPLATPESNKAFQPLLRTLNPDQHSALFPEIENSIVLSVDPKHSFVKSTGGNSIRQLQNSSNIRLAYKVYSSNNKHYRVHPVYGFIEPNAFSILKIVRYNGPNNGNAYFFIDFLKVSSDEKNAKEFFEKNPTATGERIRMEITTV